MDKHFYNEASAKKLGWEPSWFGEKYFDDKLVRAIKKWQKENREKKTKKRRPDIWRKYNN